MTALQRLQLKQSEIRSAISAELDKADGERDSATLEKLTAAAKSAEIEVRAALVAHEETAIPDSTERRPGMHRAGNCAACSSKRRSAPT